MTRVLNSIDPATAERIRDAISGKPRLKTAKPKRAEPVKCYVSQFHKFDPAKNAHTIQLPIAFRTAEYNAGRTPPALRARWVKEKREMVWLALHSYLPLWATKAEERERLRHIEFVRIGMRKLDDDNVVAAFKAVRDATCSFAAWGGGCFEAVRSIGQADDQLSKRGTTWAYRQIQCESNPRAFGIRIILHCAPRT